MKILQKILEEVMEISRIPMLLYDTDNVCVAATADTPDALTGSVQNFMNSDADSQSSGSFHYFKVICSDTLSYVLLVLSYSPDSFTVGRLTVCQLQHLIESRENSVTKSSFIRNMATGTLTPTEAERQIKRLKLSAVTWVAFVIECEEGFEDSSAYQMLEHAFAGCRMDFCCRMDETHLLLIKDTAYILKEFKVSSELPAASPKKKKAVLDTGQLAASLSLFAQTLVDMLRAELLIQTHVGYSTAASSFAELARIYREASAALQIRRTFFAECDTIAYDRLGIGRLISELPLDLCREFLNEVFGQHIPDDLDKETRNTIQIFFENNLNISETARQLYLHRNTLVYRLERLEKTLGLDIRRFEDAMTFKLGMMVLAHVQRNE